MTSTAHLLCRATLVICPVSLMGQWLEESKSKLEGSMRFSMHHGSGRIRDAHRLATDYDLVVTTYQVCIPEYPSLLLSATSSTDAILDLASGCNKAD